MTQQRGLSRRRFIAMAGAGAVVGWRTALLAPGRVLAQPKTLKILQWNHFAPTYDQWFHGTYIKEWGARHQTNVLVDSIGQAGIKSRAVAEVAAQKGHDLFLFLAPPPAHEDQVIDHREIYEECEHKYGKPIELAIKSTYNPRTKKFFGFSDSFVPTPIHYRKDLWDDVGMYPDTWEDILVGGRKIKHKHNIPVGLGLASDIDTNTAMRAVLHSFGASAQDAAGTPSLKSRETLEALKYVKALYQETMTEEVLTWDANSNNRLMLAGQGSLALNAISITRTGEQEKLPITDHLWLARAASGPVRRLGLAHVMNVYVIWKFAENIEGAKQFLVDYVGHLREAFVRSQYYNFPCFTQMVPDSKTLLGQDPRATPPDKYKNLADCLEWTTNLGYPGYTNAAIDEIFDTWIISTMFAHAAAGKVSPEEAMHDAEKAVQRIFKKWKEKGKV
ncbi:MAG: extracellular solute-binding protein [Candidatus Tectimicrobiota bacterium]